MPVGDLPLEITTMPPSLEISYRGGETSIPSNSQRYYPTALRQSNTGSSSSGSGDRSDFFFFFFCFFHIQRCAADCRLVRLVGIILGAVCRFHGYL